MSPLKWLAQAVKSAGPYMLIEMLLPGGTLIALLLWLSQHARRPRRGLWQVRARTEATMLVNVAR